MVWYKDFFLAGLFYMAPELLDLSDPARRGTQKGDVFAFGILLYEILYRKSSYDTGVLLPDGKSLRLFTN